MPPVAGLLPKIRVVADPALDARGHSAVDLRFRTSDGRTASAGFDTSPGYPGNALGDLEQRARFDDCMSYAALPLSPQGVARVVESIDGLETLADARTLLGHLVR